jgi:hypothetical protein
VRSYKNPRKPARVAFGDFCSCCAGVGAEMGRFRGFFEKDSVKLKKILKST